MPPAGPVSASEKLSSSGLRALEEFFAASSGLSRALAADDAAQFNREITGLPGALAALRKELGGAPGWGEQISALTASGRLRTARDLADAREQFRAFSTSAVALLQLARAGEEKQGKQEVRVTEAEGLASIQPSQEVFSHSCRSPF